MAFTEMNIRTITSNVMHKIALEVTEAIRKYAYECKEKGETCDIYPVVRNTSLTGRRDAHYNIVIIKRERNDETGLKSIDLDESGKMTNINRLLLVDYDYYANTITFRLIDKEFGERYKINVSENSIKGVIRKYYLSDRVCGNGITTYSFLCEQLCCFYGESYANLVSNIDDIIQRNVMRLYDFIDKHADDTPSDTDDTCSDYDEEE